MTVKRTPVADPVAPDEFRRRRSPYIMPGGMSAEKRQKFLAVRKVQHVRRRLGPTDHAVRIDEEVSARLHRAGVLRLVVWRRLERSVQAVKRETRRARPVIDAELLSKQAGGSGVGILPHLLRSDDLGKPIRAVERAIRRRRNGKHGALRNRKYSRERSGVAMTTPRRVIPDAWSSSQVGFI